MTAEKIWIRTETGLMEFSDPLPPGIAARLGKDLARVNEDGSPWDPDKPKAPAKPAAAPVRPVVQAKAPAPAVDAH
jgi:hypothetical protein